VNADALLAARGLVDLPLAREAMAARLRERGFDARVVDAMTELPRHAFLGANLLRLAYLELDLWTSDTLVLAPETVAMIAHSLELEPSARVLEIGTGSGYQTAVLAACSNEVYSLDLVATCVAQAADAVGALGLRNVTLRWGDGSGGWPEQRPFHAIVCDSAWTAAPAELVDQLRPDGGRLILPLGPPGAPQRLTLLRRQDERLVATDLGTVFVPALWPVPGASAAAAVPVEGAVAAVPVEGASAAVPVEGAPGDRPAEPPAEGAPTLAPEATSSTSAADGPEGAEDDERPPDAEPDAGGA
jgi:protein-L-isoaspartate(D-aspartate) O-methyltransferase